MSAGLRDARPDDEAAVRPLWEGCLLAHGARPDPGAFARTWALLLDPLAPLGLRVAAPDGAVAGFAIHSWAPNTWTGGVDGYLDTLFVAPAARGAGLARALVDDLRTLAARRGWQSVAWHVQAANAPARALYDRYGAPDGYLRYRVAPTT